MCELQYVSKSRQAPQHNKETILYINKLHLQIAQTSLFRYFKLFLCFSTTLHDDDDVAAADGDDNDPTSDISCLVRAPPDVTITTCRNKTSDRVWCSFRATDSRTTTHGYLRRPQP